MLTSESKSFLRRYLFIVLVFVAGFFTSKGFTKIEKPSLERAITIYPCDAPGEEFSLIPYRSMIDGVRHNYQEPPQGKAPVYRIETLDKRAIIFATKITPQNQSEYP